MIFVLEEKNMFRSLRNVLKFGEYNIFLRVEVLGVS